MESIKINLRVIDRPQFNRPVNQESVERLAESLALIGQKTPITVRPRDKYLSGQWFQGYEIVTGLHRFLAAQSLGWEEIDAFVMEADDERSYRLWTISENLHRAELTALERSKLRAEWVELVGGSRRSDDGLSSTGKPAEVRPVSSGGRGNQSGINDAARQLDIPRSTLQQDIRIAALSPEAQEAAVEHGLDDNQSALLAAAREAEPAKQVEAIQNRADRQKQHEVDSDAAMRIIKKHLFSLTRNELMELLVMIDKQLKNWS